MLSRQTLPSVLEDIRDETESAMSRELIPLFLRCICTAFSVMVKETPERINQDMSTRQWIQIESMIDTAARTIYQNVADRKVSFKAFSSEEDDWRMAALLKKLFELSLFRRLLEQDGKLDSPQKNWKVAKERARRFKEYHSLFSNTYDVGLELVRNVGARNRGHLKTKISEISKFLATLFKKDVSKVHHHLQEQVRGHRKSSSIFGNRNSIFPEAVKSRRSRESDHTELKKNSKNGYKISTEKPFKSRSEKLREFV